MKVSTEAAKEAEKAEKQARKEAEQKAKEQAKREAKETKEAGETGERAEEEAEEAEKAVQEISSETYQGNVQLVIPSSMGFKQVTQFQEYLKGVDDLRITWVEGSVDKGTTIAVSLQKPMTLMLTLNEMPMVERVDKEDERIVVRLRPPTVS
ncbi:hypothetical protein ACFLU8_01105 [Chloroflexota bacterium]